MWHHDRSGSRRQPATALGDSGIFAPEPTNTIEVDAFRGTPSNPVSVAAQPGIKNIVGTKHKNKHSTGMSGPNVRVGQKVAAQWEDN